MRIDLFKDKYFDLIIINNQSIIYFKLSQEKNKVNVLESEKITADIYSQGIFHLANVQSALEKLLAKYKLTELGIILNTPNIIFQKITIPQSTATKEVILNYLKTNFPLSIEKYSLFYQKDKYQSSLSNSIYNIFLIDKDIINNLLDIVEKHGLIPLFISPTIETFYRYLLDKAMLDFNEDYLLFLKIEDTLITVLIRNLRLTKILTEELDTSKVKLDYVIDRIYNFFKTELQPQTKILFFIEETFEFRGNHQSLSFTSSTINIILKGACLTFRNVLNEKQIIDFMPVKNYNIYFLNRLPSIITLLAVYTILLLIFISIPFLYLQSKLNNEIKQLKSQTQNIAITNQNETQLNNLQNLIASLNSKIFDKISSVVKIKSLPGIEGIYFENEAITFNLKINNTDLGNIKTRIQQQFPESKLIEEINLGNEVKLKYNF